ncbi:MAG: WD40/YVTN/BNR-like repeat-containing protein [Gemmatimonadales bacterium]
MVHSRGGTVAKVLVVLAIAVAVCDGTAVGQAIDPTLLEEFNWRLVGPASPAGRAWSVVGVPSDPKTFYVTTAGGGLWKSTNHGTTVEPVFNDQATASTGAVAIAASNTDIVWVGTGEPANTRANSWGDGVYKSTDGGATWTNMGLRDTRQISSIVIHPTDPDIVLVAAMGHLWGANSERGVFKTTDGGQTWRKTLFVNDTTGVIDMRVDPNDPDVLYAATWDRFRYGGGDMREAGPGAGIYKSTDGGDTWAKLTNGLPTDDMAKINLAVAYHDSRIVYAAILTGERVRGGRTSEQGGIFRSDDAGAHWRRVNPMMTSYYYQRIEVDPSDDETVWMPVFDLWRSTDGGEHFEKQDLTHVHNDLHGMWIDPTDPEHLIVCGDGGVNVSFDRGDTWTQPPLPIGQFYEVAVDDQDPYYIYGGMQDTGHWTGPSRTYDAEGITNYDWIKLRFNGDGMSIHPDPRDPNIIHMVQEFGNFSKLDLRTWKRTELKPDPSEAERRGLHPFRYDWTPPMILSRRNPDVAYLGSNYLFKYSGGGEHWEVISDDLTRQQDRSPRGVSDGYHSYGALFSIEESPLNDQVIWTGADDGPIHVSTDGGATWTDVTDNLPDGAPTNAVVAEIEASNFGDGIAYVAYDAHKLDDTRPYLYRTTDFGRTWENITGDLPANGSTWVIVEDPVNSSLLFAGTEFGVFVTVDRGAHWTRFKNNLPTSGVRSMVIQPRAKELVVGTFGRGIWVVDIEPLEQLTPEVLSREVHLFDVPSGVLYRTRYTYGATIEQLNGDMFFRAANPPFGTVLTYYLSHDFDVPATIAIFDERGHVLRKLAGPGSAGIHRINWDLKPGEVDSTRRGLTPSERDAGQWVMPAIYGATLNVDGESVTQLFTITSEGDGVRRVPVRK